MRVLILCLLCVGFAQLSFASGFGVFTQGASGLGQANAVVAHPTGASSLYFNPALLNDVPGQQLEVGTTGVLLDRSISLDSGDKENSKDSWNFPSTFFFTNQVNEKFSAGFGLFFPFGLSTEWDDDYEGRYLGTYGQISSLNINPAMSVRVSDSLSLAAGFSMLYLDATIERKLNQAALIPGLPDIEQRFEGEGWGAGYNLGLLYKLTEQVSFGATYRSHIDVDVEGRAEFDNVDPNLALFFPSTPGETNIRLPAQATFGLAYTPTETFTVEVGARWEDWSSTKDLRIELDYPVLGQSTDITPRDWHATWAYNIGLQYKVVPQFTLNAGYLYGENAVPDSTFEPLIPDTDAHLYTVGADWVSGSWSISGAFGYETHEKRDKANTLGDPLTGIPVANGSYETDIYLVGVSVGYRF